MIRFLSDEDFNNDIVRVQDVGLSGRPDPAVLAWAAHKGRVLLSHDVATLVAHALARLDAGETLSGVLVAPQTVSVAAVIADLELIDEVSDPAEWQGRVIFLPLR